MKNKIGILINSRLESQRLPNKALADICDKKLIEHIILRKKTNKITKKIVLCVPNNKKNLSLIKIAKKNKINYHMGSNDDVLSRLYFAAKKYKIDTMIVSTGDNPLVDISSLENLTKYHLKNKNDFSKIKGLPWGSFCYVVNYKSVKKVLNLKKTNNTEAWVDYFLKNKLFKCGTLKIKDKSLIFPKLRLTVDTFTDLRMMRVLYGIFYKRNTIVDLKKVISFCKKNKEVYKINSHIIQKKPVPAIF